MEQLFIFLKKAYLMSFKVFGILKNTNYYLISNFELIELGEP